MTQHLHFLVIGLTIFGSIGVGFAAPEGNINSAQQDIASSEPIPSLAGAETHETRADSETASQFSNENEMAAEPDGEAAAPATHRSFMAGWRREAGALGYLLDVSTSSSFDSYVEGYHDLDVGNVTGRVVTSLERGTTYYYRVRPYSATAVGSYAEVVSGTTAPGTGGLTIHPTFDSSITNNANAAAIEAMIMRAISIYESLFRDPITIELRFRYATTAPNGTPLGQGILSQSLTGVYTIPWSTYVSALREDAKTSNDILANLNIPRSALSASITPGSANGRAVGLNMPPAMSPNGTVGTGGLYDGIVTLNSSKSFQFTRPTSGSKFDAQRITEHEIDEVIGLGSRLGQPGTGIRPQDLFSWRAPGTRNITSSYTRYFSINGGWTNIVSFNQHANGDFGDWASFSCPQTHPYVQNAFCCPGQFYDIAATTPEGINLDVIGYDLVGAPQPIHSDFNTDGYPDYVIYDPDPRYERTSIIGVGNRGVRDLGPYVHPPWQVVAVADFNRDAAPDYLLFNPNTGSTVIWYMHGPGHVGGRTGPTLPGGWNIGALADFNSDGYPDYLLYNANTGRTVVWYMRDNIHFASHNGPTLVSGWTLAGVADFNGDGDPDYVLFRPSTRQSVIWYLSGLTRTSSRSGPTILPGYDLVGVDDFNRDGKPDYVLYNPGTGGTVIWYLSDNLHIATLYGPNVGAGKIFVAP